MAITPIPNVPQTTSLNGNEIVPGVQAGTNVKIPVQQIANFTIDQIGGVDPGVLSFNTRSGVVTLESSDVTAAGGATLASPAFTGVPTAPTATVGTDTTQIATTAFVLANVGTGFAPIASPTFTGIPEAPTPSPGTDTTQLATTAFVATSYAPLASPALTGTPTAPTASNGTNTTQLATTAFVLANSTGAPLNSPAFTGVPTAPTATLNTNTTQIATTAFVEGQASTTTPLIDGSAAVGTGTTWARADHVHPTDTTRLAIAGGTMTGALTPASVAGIVGTTTNNNAASGSIGEYISNYQAIVGGVTSNTPFNVTSISLTAGDWDVEGCVAYVISSVSGQVQAAVSSTSATFPTGTFSGLAQFPEPVSGSLTTTIPTGPARFSLASTTTIYLVGEAGGSGINAGGSISARRRR